MTLAVLAVDLSMCMCRCIVTETAESRPRCNEVSVEENTKGRRHQAGVHLVTGELMTGCLYMLVDAA